MSVKININTLEKALEYKNMVYLLCPLKDVKFILNNYKYGGYDDACYLGKSKETIINCVIWAQLEMACNEMSEDSIKEAKNKIEIFDLENENQVLSIFTS